MSELELELGLKPTRVCDCDWCSKFSPVVKVAMEHLNEEQTKIFDELIGDYMMAETDAVYWKEKFYGKWPSDDEKSIRHHIKYLENRILEIRNDEIANR